MPEKSIIDRSPNGMSGTPVFRGTRVPVQPLFDYLEAGDPLAEFLDDFPTVTREQALEVLELRNTTNKFVATKLRWHILKSKI
ncbi:MAG TPA: DUF433 domain-containing protein [Anaerolineae bacterium]|nr:DUF433 domain-containing protein [Anaerolineae bacterium]